MRRLLILAALVGALALPPSAVAATDQLHRTRCHGEPRPTHNLGALGGPWTCRPSSGWYWAIPPIWGVAATARRM
jgi:hypothetical protein